MPAKSRMAFTPARKNYFYSFNCQFTYAACPDAINHHMRALTNLARSILPTDERCKGYANTCSESLFAAAVAQQVETLKSCPNCECKKFEISRLDIKC
jgi:hypothetical protein